MTSVPPTLADLTYMVAVELKSVREGSTDSAGGSLQEVIDTAGRDEAADYWNTGPFWVLRTPNGSAPQGEYESVSDFGGGTITLRSALTATVPNNADYAVGRRRYPLDVLRQSVNAAYRDLGRVPQSDTSNETTSATTEYTIPTAAQKDLRQVWLETVTSLANKKGWVEIPKGIWRQEGSTLYIPQLPVERELKYVYVDEAPQMRDYNDTLSAFVHPKRIIYKAASHALFWRSEKLNPAARDDVRQRINYFLDQDLRAARNHPIHVPKNKSASITLSAWMKGVGTSKDQFQYPGPP